MRSTEVYNMLAHTSMLTSREQSPNPSLCLQNKVWNSWGRGWEKERREVEAKHIPAAERCLWSVERKTKLGTYHVSVDRPAPMSCWTTRRGTSRERSEEKKLNGMSLEAEGTFCSAVGLWRDKCSEEDESPPCDRCLSSVMPRDVCYCRNPSLKHVPADWTSVPRSYFARRSNDGSPTGGAGEGSATLQQSSRAENADDRGATMCWRNCTRRVVEGESKDFYISLVVVLFKLMKFQDCLHLWAVRVCGPSIMLFSLCGSLLVLVSVCLLYHFSEECCCAAGFH